jgi:FMN-dependent NADH-azoreductase
MKNILVFKGNPKEKNSFGNELADHYIQGAKQAEHNVECIRIADLQLSQYLYEGFDENRIV